MSGITKTKAYERFEHYANIILSIVIILLILIRIFLFPVLVVGSSMYPTYSNAEILLTNPFKHNFNYGDVVIIKTTKEEKEQYDTGARLIKRIVGKPNDTLKIQDGILYINEKKESDIMNHADFGEITECGNLESGIEIHLKDNEYFVMGDNRNNSLDSRFIGPIQEEQIITVIRN